MEKEYIIVVNIEYYEGDCQHPKGWRIQPAYNKNNEEYIGTYDVCKKIEEELNNQSVYLNHGEYSKYYRIAELVDNDANYQNWLDSYVNWENCPDGDYLENTEWAENEAYNNNGVLPISTYQNSYIYLINLDI